MLQLHSDQEYRMHMRPDVTDRTAPPPPFEFFKFAARVSRPHRAAFLRFLAKRLDSYSALLPDRAWSDKLHKARALCVPAARISNLALSTAAQALHELAKGVSDGQARRELADQYDAIERIARTKYKSGRKAPKPQADAAPKRPRGRPRKHPVADAPKRPRGRPRKEPTNEPASPKRPPGRPPKNPYRALARTATREDVIKAFVNDPANAKRAKLLARWCARRASVLAGMSADKRADEAARQAQRFAVQISEHPASATTAAASAIIVAACARVAATLANVEGEPERQLEYLFRLTSR